MKKISVLCALALTLMSAGFAQAQKIVYINTDAILDQLPEMKAAESQFDAYAKTKQADIEKRQTDLQNLYTQYQADAAKQTEAVNKQRGEELQKKQEELAQITEIARKDLADKQKSLFEPINTKVQNAIAKVAQASAWDYVFDSNTLGILFKTAANDGTAAVKKELGLQ